MEHSWTLKFEAKPWLLNNERQGAGGGFYKRAERVRMWRNAYGKLALEQHIPPLNHLHAEVLQVCRTRRLPDTGSCFPTVKAAIDGLVDARVLPDDGPEYVHSLTFLSPRTMGYDALVLRITGPVCSAQERVERALQERDQYTRRLKRTVS